MVDDIVESAGFVYGGVFVSEDFPDLAASVFVGFCEVGVSVGVAVSEGFDGPVLRGGVEHGVATFEPVSEMLIKVFRFSVDWFGFT